MILVRNPAPMVKRRRVMRKRVKRVHAIREDGGERSVVRSGDAKVRKGILRPSLENIMEIYGVLMSHWKKMNRPKMMRRSARACGGQERKKK